MHVIIEGPDGSGKSTLARELSRRLFMPVVNAVRPRDCAEDDVIYALLDREPTIFDRLHLSEIVYGSLGKAGVLARGPARFNAVAIEHVCHRLRTFNVICVPSPTVAEVADDYVPTLDKQRMVRAGFEHAVGAVTSLEWVRYGIGCDVDEVARMAHAYLKLPPPAPSWGRFLEAPASESPR